MSDLLQSLAKHAKGYCEHLEKSRMGLSFSNNPGDWGAADMVEHIGKGTLCVVPTLLLTRMYQYIKHSEQRLAEEPVPAFLNDADNMIRECEEIIEANK